MTAACLAVGGVIFVVVLILIGFFDRSSVDMTNYTDEEIENYNKAVENYYKAIEELYNTKLQ